MREEARVVARGTFGVAGVLDWGNEGVNDGIGSDGGVCEIRESRVCPAEMGAVEGPEGEGGGRGEERRRMRIRSD